MKQLICVILLFASTAPAQGWLRELLARLPQETWAVAAVETEAGRFLRSFFDTLAKDERALADHMVQRTGAYQDLEDLIRKVSSPLDARVVVVVRNSSQDPEIPVARPSSLPRIACLFWMQKKADDAPVQELLRVLVEHSQVFGVRRVLRTQAGAGEVLEFTNPGFSGTGEIAFLHGSELFAVSDSGALLREIGTDIVDGQPSFATAVNHLTIDDPGPGRGRLLFQSQRLLDLLAADEKSLAENPSGPDPAWMVAHRADAEKVVFRDHLASVCDSPSDLSEDARQDFNRRVRKHLMEMWRRENADVFAEQRGFLRGARAAVEMIPAGECEVAFPESSMAPIVRRLVGR